MIVDSTKLRLIIHYAKSFIEICNTPIWQKKLNHERFAKRTFAEISQQQGGITCGAIDEPRKSSKAIDERVIINFRDKNVVIARFRDKNVYRQLFCSIDRFSVLSKAFLFYPQLFCSINMANIFEFLSKDGNITPEKARKSRQMQFHDKTAYVWGLRYR